MTETTNWRRWVLRALVALGLTAVVYILVIAAQVWMSSGLDQRDRADAIVVLGAAQYDGRPSPALQARLDHARELYEEGLADRVVLTGAGRPGDRFTEAYAGYRYLARLGVPTEAMTIVDDGENTYESLAATRRVLREQGLDRVLLVSDGYHNRRLQGIADELGLDASVASASGRASPWEVARETVRVAAGEIVGYRRLTNWSS